VSERRRKLRGLAALLRPYRGRGWLTLGSMLVAVVAGLAPPLLAGLAVNDVKDGDTGGLTIIVIVFLVAALLNWGATYLETYLVNFVGQRVLQDLRIQIFRHLQRLSIGFYSRNRAGVLISRLTNDVEALNQLVTDGIYTIISTRSSRS
jgi:ATP-binding cassette subfamily B protein